MILIGHIASVLKNLGNWRRYFGNKIPDYLSSFDKDLNNIVTFIDIIQVTLNQYSYIYATISRQFRIENLNTNLSLDDG